MSSTATAPADLIRQSLASLTSSVDIARRRADGGDIVELRDLDRAVAEICTAVARLPLHERAGLRPPLMALIDELDKLAATLKRQHGLISESLRAQSSHHQAALAYGKAPSGPKRR
ncbi:MAG TPA: hypothetical protein VF274_03410 [Alphaproteobacteria bacterium]